MTKLPPPPTAERVHEVFDYDPETGVLRWRVNRGKVKAGDVAGCPGGGGLQVGLDRRLCYVRQIAWLYMTGEWREGLNHRNLDCTDNRFSNLRPATHSQSVANGPLRKHTESRLKGVHFRVQYGTYTAKIRINYRQIHIGTFKTAREAHAAYLAKAKELFGEFARAA